QRREGGLEDHADTDGGAEREPVIHLAAGAFGVVEAPDRARVGKDAAEDAVFLRETEREGRIKPGDGVVVAAERIIDAGRVVDVARADAVAGEAAEIVAAADEPFGHAAVAVPEQGAALERGREDHVLVEHARVDPRRGLGLGEGGIAAETGEVLVEREDEARRRIDNRVATVIGIGEAEGRGHGRAFLGADDRRGIVLDIADLVVAQPVAQGEPTVLAHREAEPRLEAGVLGPVGGLAVFALALVDAEPGEEITVEERGLGEAEFEVAELRRAREGAGDRLAAAEEVALGHRDLRGEALVGRVGAAKAERAGRLLLDLDADDGGIRVRTLAHGDAGVREIAEAPDAVLGGADLARVEGIALDDAELAPDHAVEGTGVADDVDALDEDALALLELEDDVDDA